MNAIAKLSWVKTFAYSITNSGLCFRAYFIALCD